MYGSILEVFTTDLYQKPTQPLDRVAENVARQCPKGSIFRLAEMPLDLVKQAWKCCEHTLVQFTMCIQVIPGDVFNFFTFLCWYVIINWLIA